LKHFLLGLVKLWQKPEVGKPERLRNGHLVSFPQKRWLARRKSR
jgi:hypothetical protein